MFDRRAHHPDVPGSDADPTAAPDTMAYRGRRVRRSHPALIVCAVVVVSTLAGGCAFGPRSRTHLRQLERARFGVVDERGAPIAGVVFTTRSLTKVSDGKGHISLALSQPIAGVLSADGKLDEPLAIAPGDDFDRVVMLDRVGPHGTRVAMHFGGDVMLGRRFEEPTRRGTPVVGDPESARAVVSDIAPLAAAGDLTVVNLETVIGGFPADESAMGKRFLLQSPPVITDALQSLGVDAVTLGNNHAYDWGEAGIGSTLAALDPVGIVAAGAGTSRDDAVRGVLVPAADRLVGLISATTVNGDFVNDQLPRADEAVPSDLPESEAWQYEERLFGFGAPGDRGYLPTRPRRAGSAWRDFRRSEEQATPDEVAAFWADLGRAFPELQDWTARRGHGGAAGYERDAVADEITRLRSLGAEVVVVQFHAGFQFSDRPSPAVRRISRDAIDDGADFVISHHPHVLQGFEWYDGHLIAHSLGNFVFDQDFHLTFPSVLLRLVVDDAGLVDARVIPVMLDDYRPVPVTGTAAERIVRLLDTRSVLPGVAARVEDLRVGAIVDAADGDDPVAAATLRSERNTGVISAVRTETSTTVDLEPGDTMTIPTCATSRVDRLPASVEYAVDRFGWGAIDDVTADGHRFSPMHWIVRSPGADGATLGKGVTDRSTDDSIKITAESSTTAYARVVARIPTRQHRWFSSDREPIDADPTFALEFDARRTGGADGVARFQAFHVSDTDPTADPESTLVVEWEQPIGLTSRDEWQHIEIPLDRLDEPASAGEPSIDAVMVTFSTPPARGQEFRFDNVRFLEWRRAPATSRPIWDEVDALRTDEAVSFDVRSSGCPIRTDDSE